MRMDMLSYMMGRANGGGGGGGNPLAGKALLTAMPGSKSFHYQLQGSETPITEAPDGSKAEIIGHVDGTASMVDLVSGETLVAAIVVGPEQMPRYPIGSDKTIKPGMVIAVNVA